MNLTVKSAIDMKGILGIEATKNPTLSTSYRPLDIPTPNRTVLEAQQRVCTGPAQTRPLDQAQTMAVLDTIVRSGVLDKRDIFLICICGFDAFMCYVYLV